MEAGVRVEVRMVPAAPPAKGTGPGFGEAGERGWAPRVAGSSPGDSDNGYFPQDLGRPVASFPSLLLSRHLGLLRESPHT